MASPEPLRTRRERASGDPAPPFVLVADDEPLLLRSLRHILENGGYRIALAESLESAEPLLAEPGLGVVLADVRLGRDSGLEILEHVKRERPEVEVIMMTGHASIESAVGCIRRGAFDYLAKPFDDVHRIRNTVGKALERRALVQRNRELELELALRERSAGQELPVSLAAYERCALERALWECGGDAAAAAARLGIGRSTLYRKLARHDLTPSRTGGPDRTGGWKAEVDGVDSRDPPQS